MALFTQHGNWYICHVCQKKIRGGYNCGQHLINEHPLERLRDTIAKLQERWDKTQQRNLHIYKLSLINDLLENMWAELKRKGDNGKRLDQDTYLR